MLFDKFFKFLIILISICIIISIIFCDKIILICYLLAMSLLLQLYNLK